MIQPNRPALLLPVSGPALGSNGDRDTNPGQRASRRTERWLLKELQRHLTEAVSAAACGYPLGGGLVSVDVTEAFVAHVSGIAHCGSPWSCPLCSPVVREAVAKLYNDMATRAAGLGWSMLFGVGTLRHHAGDRLASMLPVVQSMVHETLRGRTWDRFKLAHDYAGMLATTEIDWGPVNGWHPHRQTLLFFRGVVSDSAVDGFSEWWHGRWDRVATRAGYGPLTAEGLNVSRLREEDRIGDYLVKPAGSWGIGREMARGDVKGHSGSGLVPAFDLLRPETADLWREYEGATKGKSFRMASKGLQKELSELVEKSDEELATEAAELPVIFRVDVSGATWKRLVAWSLVGTFLENLEVVSRLLVFVAGACGHEVPRIEVSEVDGKGARDGQAA